MDKEKTTKLMPDLAYISLGEYQDPPNCFINIDYKQQPTNLRKCIECGRFHDTFIENTMTGERIEEFSKCKDCMLFGTRVEWGGTARCMTSDGRNVNMAEELNRLEKEIINATG